MKRTRWPNRGKVIELKPLQPTAQVEPRPTLGLAFFLDEAELTDEEEELCFVLSHLPYGSVPKSYVHGLIILMERLLNESEALNLIDPEMHSNDGGGGGTRLKQTG